MTSSSVSTRYLSRRAFLVLGLVSGVGLTIQLTPGWAQSADSLVDQGLAAYEAGRYQTAIDLWQQAARRFRQQGDPLRQAMVLNYQAAAQQELADLLAVEQTLNQSFALLEAIPPSPDQIWIQAQAHNTLGTYRLLQGQPEVALGHLRQAQQGYQHIQDQYGVIGSRLNQVQAFQLLGLNQRASAILATLAEQLNQLPPSKLTLTGLRSLANTERLLGLLDASEAHLQKALEESQRLNLNGLAEALQLDLGNTLHAKARSARELNDRLQADQHTQAALDRYQTLSQHSTSPLLRIQAQRNALKLQIDTLLLETQIYQQEVALQTLLTQQQRNADAQFQARIVMDLETSLDQQSDTIQQQVQPILQTALQDIQSIPPSHFALQTQLSLVQDLIQFNLLDSTFSFNFPDLQSILTTVLTQARGTHNPIAEAEALGTLGRLYQVQGLTEQALQLTQEAILLARDQQGAALSYPWDRQLGQLLQQAGDLEEALLSYTTAFNNLEALRTELAIVSRDVQFSFRDEVEPIYRELIDLLTQAETPVYNPSQAQIVIESLQLAELNNFFQDSCLDLIRPTLSETQLDQTVALIYPIILPERIEVIVSIPALDKVQSYNTTLSRSQVEATLVDLRRTLSDTTVQSAPSSEQVYQWLIAPIESVLEHWGVTVLVFVLDHYFRNVPMAALRDPETQTYLIQKDFILVLAPGFRFFELSVTSGSLSPALRAGLTEARQVEEIPFEALRFVAEELEQVGNVIPSPPALLNEQFTQAAIIQRLQSVAFPILHLATHGQFSSRADRTFIVSGDRGDKATIGIPDLETILQSPLNTTQQTIELLVLSACETATGDNRAALGLAGVAVRAGARSTLASLWAVDDRSTSRLMGQFYANLNPTINKAQALKLAQLELLQDPAFEHTYYWSPFVLIGNWT